MKISDRINFAKSTHVAMLIKSIITEIIYRSTLLEFRLDSLTAAKSGEKKMNRVYNYTVFYFHIDENCNLQNEIVGFFPPCFVQDVFKMSVYMSPFPRILFSIMNENAFIVIKLKLEIPFPYFISPLSTSTFRFHKNNFLEGLLGPLQ